MKTLKQLERALSSAGRRVAEYYCKLEDACSEYVVPTNALPAFVDVHTVLKGKPQFIALGISWNARRYWLDNILDFIDNDGVAYRCESFEECVRELDALGYSVE